jgi:hypothetical protein
MLKPGVRHTSVREGSYISLGERGFLFKDKRLQPVIDRVLSALDGARSPNEIRNALPEQARSVFDLVVARLASSAMLTEAPTRTYPKGVEHSLIQMLQDQMTRWEPCLEAWSTRRITLWVEQNLLPLVASPLLAQGARNIVVIDHDNTARDSLERLNILADVRLIVPTMISGEEPGGIVLLLTTNTLSNEVAEIVGRHDRTIPAMIAPGGVIIGPEIEDGIQRWRHETPYMTGLGGNLPRHALHVAAAILAFEAFRSITAEFADDPDRAERRKTDVRVVRADGTVTTHDKRVAQASGRTPAPIVVSKEIVGTTDRWHHPDVGAFADADPGGRAFPLPHAALRVRYRSKDGRPQQETITAWGTSPAEAVGRCRLQAFELLAHDREGIVVAAGSEEELRIAAQVISSAQMLEPHEICAACIDLDGDWSDETRMLARLVRLYWGGNPAILLHRDEGICVAWANVADAHAVGIAREADGAVLEALGEAISTAQTGHPTHLQTHQPRRRLATLNQDLLGLQLSGFRPANTLDPVRMLHLPGLPDDIALGLIGANA